MRYCEIVEITENDDDLFGGARLTTTLSDKFDFPEGGDLGYAIGGGGITYGNGHRTDGLVIVSRGTNRIAFIPDFTYFDDEPTQEHLEELFYDDDTEQLPLSLQNVQKFLTLDENEEEMFGSSERVKKGITTSTFASNISKFSQELKDLIQANAGPATKSLVKELAHVCPEFRNNRDVYDEAFDLAFELIDHELLSYIPIIARWLANDPNRAYDEDVLHDGLSDVISDCRVKSDLWQLAVEVARELEDADDLEFDIAMVIEGEIAIMLRKTIPQALSGSVSLQGLTENDDDMFGSSTRPDARLIAHELELWLRRRQSGSRRGLIPSSVKYVEEVIAAFNHSFLKGIETWSEYPLYGNTDVKYNIREYFEQTHNVDFMDYVEQLNENK